MPRYDPIQPASGAHVTTVIDTAVNMLRVSVYLLQNDIIYRKNHHENASIIPDLKRSHLFNFFSFLHPGGIRE